MNNHYYQYRQIFHSMSVYETFSVMYYLTFGCDTKSQALK
jgi:hypothetical protein